MFLNLQIPHFTTFTLYVFTQFAYRVETIKLINWLFDWKKILQVFWESSKSCIILQTNTGSSNVKISSYDWNLFGFWTADRRLID